MRQHFVPYTIRFDNEIVDMILALEEHFEIHWATMWNHNANTEIVPALGLDEYPVMVCDYDAGIEEAAKRGLQEWEIRGLWYPKTGLIPDYVQGRPFAWVDDDHTWRDDRFLREQEDVSNFLLVRPNPHDGLTWEQVQELITWAQTEAHLPKRPVWEKPIPAPETTVPFDLDATVDYDALFHEQIVAAGLLDDDDEIVA